MSVLMKSGTGVKPNRDGEKSSHYLVVQDRIGTCQALLDTVIGIAARDGDACFTVLVPARPIARGLIWTEGESAAAAERTASLLRATFEDAGVKVAAETVGDASPSQAIADALFRGERYIGIVIGAPPSAVLRRLGLDISARLRRRFALPVISVATQSGRNHSDAQARNNFVAAASVR